MEDTKIPVFGKDAEAAAAAAKAKADTEAAAAAAAAAAAKAAEATRVNLVKMVRGPEFPAPHEADVHPEEVANYAVGGWTAAV